MSSVELCILPVLAMFWDSISTISFSWGVWNVPLFSTAQQRQGPDTLIIRVNINLLDKQHLSWYYHCFSGILHVGQNEKNPNWPLPNKVAKVSM